MDITSNIPVEILSEIFLYSSIVFTDNGDGGYRPDPWQSRSTIPTIVSHVSTRWRAIAIAFTPLWAHVMMSERPPFEKTALWLIRSRQHPLEICLRSLEQCYVADAIRLLVPHSYRWKSFKFHQMPIPTNSDQLGESIQLFLQGIAPPDALRPIYAPMLEVLELEMGDIPMSETLKLAPLAIDAPRLWDLYVQRIPVDWGRFSPTLSNLTSFGADVYWNESGETIGFCGVLGLLSQMPNLRFLIISVAINDKPINVIPQLIHDPAATVLIPIKLEFLERLEIYSLMDECAELWWWLNCVDAPNLTDLEINHRAAGVMDYIEEEERHIDGWPLQPRFPSLRTFLWAPLNECYQCLPSLLKVAPSISQITVATYNTMLFMGQDHNGSPQITGSGYYLTPINPSDSSSMDDCGSMSLLEKVLSVFALQYPAMDISLVTKVSDEM